LARDPEIIVRDSIAGHKSVGVVLDISEKYQMIQCG